MASTYTWKQDNGTATISVLVPFDTAHSDLRLLLSRRRFTLEQRGAILLQRRLFGTIDPRRTRAYTMHEYSGAWNEVTLARSDRDRPHSTCVHARTCLLLFVESDSPCVAGARDHFQRGSRGVERNLPRRRAAAAPPEEAHR